MSYRHLITAAVLTAAWLGGTEPASATLVTFVSTTGIDTGNCAVKAPCRTLTFAIGLTAPGGELRILNSGGYGSAATINKSMTIAGGGNSITTPLIIDAASGTVVVRDLVVDGRGVANANGIRIINGAVVHIERCVVEQFKQAGLSFLVANDAIVTITDTTMRKNASNGAFFTGTAGLKVVADNSQFLNNGSDGFLVRSGTAAVVNSVATENGGAGFAVDTGAALLLERSTAAQNLSGLHVFAASTGRISNSTFTANDTGIINDGTLQTRQNNMVSGNTTNSSGSAPSNITAF